MDVTTARRKDGDALYVDWDDEQQGWAVTGEISGISYSLHNTEREALDELDRMLLSTTY